MLFVLYSAPAVQKFSSNAPFKPRYRPYIHISSQWSTVLTFTVQCLLSRIVARCATGNHMSAVHYDIVGKLENGMNTTLKILFDKLGVDASHYRHSGRNSNDAHAKLKMHYQVIAFTMKSPNLIAFDGREWPVVTFVMFCFESIFTLRFCFRMESSVGRKLPV